MPTARAATSDVATVLALPAKGVADAIDEVEKKPPIHAHQIAVRYTGIAIFEDVAQDFTFGVIGIVYPRGAPGCAEAPRDPPDRFAGFSGRAKKRSVRSDRSVTPASASNLTSANGKRCAETADRRPRPDLPFDVVERKYACRRA